LISESCDSYSSNCIFPLNLLTSLFAKLPGNVLCEQIISVSYIWTVERLHINNI
jgi:hypothetical protein